MSPRKNNAKATAWLSDLDITLKGGVYYVCSETVKLFLNVSKTCPVTGLARIQGLIGFERCCFFDMFGFLSWKNIHIY